MSNNHEKPIVDETGENTYWVHAHTALVSTNKFISFRREEGDRLQLNNYNAIIVKTYRSSAGIVAL